MRRRPLVMAGIALAAVAIVLVGYLALVRDATVTPRLVSSVPVATIGSGSEAVAVTGDGAVLTWLTPPAGARLPALALTTPPKSGRLAGPALEQVKVLAATPRTLLPYVESAHFGESGVDVKLTTGIELRFGNSGQAARKWKSAAAVLADPSVTALDYVDLHSPGRPGVGGSGHALPPVP